MARAWVLVANHTHARLFEAEKRAGSLHEIDVLTYPEGRLRGQELISDSPGRDRNRKTGEASHAVGSERDYRHTGAERFARDIAHALERGRQEGRYEKLYIVAEPTMVGSLRNAMSSPTLATVAGEEGKNLVTCDAEEIRAQLPVWL